MNFPTHIVAAGALVVNDKDEVLLVKTHIGDGSFQEDKLKMVRI